MGLTSSLVIGRSALAASQVALQVTGNNIANAATPGYHRQRVELAPRLSQRHSANAFLGRGVRVSDVRRVLDPAVQARLRSSISKEHGAQVDLSVLSQIEQLTNELTGTDISSQLSNLFNAFSELANNPASTVTRASVIEQGASIAAGMRDLRSDLLNERERIESQLDFNVGRADELLTDIGRLNAAIINSEVGSGEDGNLRDQRDVLLNELSELMDITVIEQANGSTDVLVDSTPVVFGSSARGLELELRSVDGKVEARVLVKERGEALREIGGRIGGLLAQRESGVQGTIDDLDELASALIFEVNKLHTSGRPAGRLTDVTGTQVIAAADVALAFNDPTNETLAGLPFAPTNGSFNVTMYDGRGDASAVSIAVDLDGVDATGAAGFADDMSLTDLAAALDAIPNLNAQVTPAGELRVFTDDGYDVAFSEDSSGILAVLGINTYFRGTKADDIAVNQILRDDPAMLTVGLRDGTNETALAIAGLRESAITSLGGQTLAERWLNTVETNAVKTASASARFEALTSVRQSLEAQDRAVSGVSMDEESINLITYQQQYSGAARFIALIDELTQTLLGLV